jgi:hypothetical protein
LAVSYEFKFDEGRMKPRTRKLDPRLRRKLFGIAKLYAPKSEAWMKQKAPWTDRTTNARNGLKSRAFNLANKVFGFVLAHSVSYGIYLELGTKYMKARPVIVPAMDRYGPMAFRATRKLMRKLGN